VVDGVPFLTAVAPASRSGLSTAAAAARLRRWGPNRLVREERLALLKRLLALVADPMALMLGGASLLYFLLGETTDAWILAVALVPVLGVDVFLEARSRSALAKLAEAVQPSANVWRDGVAAVVPTAALVPGDLLELQEGSFVAADGVLVEAANLSLDESSLTGESEPQGKHALAAAGEAAVVAAIEAAAGASAIPADDALATVVAAQRVFAGSLVLAGHGVVVVTATGARTRFGDIATLVAGTDTTATPLQRRTGRLVRWLAVVAVVTAVAVFGLGLAHGESWQRALLSGISLAMAAIPEEYPLVLTLFLSVGAWRLARRGMLVRRLASVETLGSTTVVCTDKTGTLTVGHFELVETVPLAAAVDEPQLLADAVLACELVPADPMDRAIAVRASARGVDPEAVRARWQLVRDYDFDAIGKHMAHAYTAANGAGTRVAAKGALEGILGHCAATPAERAAAEAANARLANAGMRVLAVAAKAGQALGADRAADESALRLVGLLGFRDPLRPEVPAAVAECRAAGIRLKMITGDHVLTARAIAAAAGFADADAVVTGDELARQGPDEFAASARERTVFARISPAQKHAIVGALQAAGEVVAMTGDGVNDAPALRLADIGISMGKRGTEVARAAADLVLLDDDFASIVATVREGRHLFTNIQAAFLYILAFHVPIVLLAFATVVLSLPLLLLPVHLVWLELIIHPVSAVVFQAEPAPPGLMQRPPRSPRAPLLPRRALWSSLLAGLVLSAVVLWLYVSHVSAGEVGARSLAWACLLLGYQVLVLVEWGALRGGRRLPTRPVVWWVWSACLLSLPLAMAFAPLAATLHLRLLSFGEWGLALGCALAATGWRFFTDRRGNVAGRA
jgi:Ca2+-transporting ATPase